jgi:hypothetical protein
MIELRYSPPNELDIGGTVPELCDVRRAVLEVAKSTKARVELNTDSSIDPNPYDATLSRLIVETGTGPTKVSVTNGTIHIVGSPSCLETLASFLNFKPDAQKGDHAHYEYYEGNQWVAPDSMPLVFCVR